MSEPRISDAMLAEFLRRSAVPASGWQDFDDVCFDLRDARQRIEALEAALREGEWSYYTVDGDPACGFCWALPFDDEDEPGVHSDDCLFAKPAIRAAIGGRDGDLAVCPGCGHTEKACTCDEVME